MPSSLATVPAGCWVTAVVKFESDVVAEQRGPVKRCANHISEDVRAGVTYVVISSIIINLYY